MKNFKILPVVLGLIAIAPFSAQAQNYYIGGSNNASSTTAAPIYTAPSNSYSSSTSPIMLNQMLDGSYKSNSRNSRGGYSGSYSGSSQKYSLGQTPEQINAKRARADAAERERQREAKAQQAMQNQQLSQAQQTENYMQKVGASNSGNGSGTGTVKKRVYVYNPTNTDITTPKRIFNSLR